MYSVKSFTAHQINKMSNRKGKIWQDESYDRVIRDEGEFLEKLGYIANNPYEGEFIKRIRRLQVVLHTTMDRNR